jgi:hypothetical protein
MRAYLWALRSGGMTYREIARASGRSVPFVGRVILAMELEALA